MYKPKFKEGDRLILKEGMKCSYGISEKYLNIDYIDFSNNFGFRYKFIEVYMFLYKSENIDKEFNLDISYMRSLKINKIIKK